MNKDNIVDVHKFVFLAHSIKSKQEIFNEDKIMLEVEYVAPLEKSVVERMTSGEMSLKEFLGIEKFMNV